MEKGEQGRQARGESTRGPRVESKYIRGREKKEGGIEGERRQVDGETGREWTNRGEKQGRVQEADEDMRAVVKETWKV